MKKDIEKLVSVLVLIGIQQKMALRLLCDLMMKLKKNSKNMDINLSPLVISVVYGSLQKIFVGNKYEEEIMMNALEMKWKYEKARNTLFLRTPADGIVDFYIDRDFVDFEVSAGGDLMRFRVYDSGRVNMI